MRTIKDAVYGLAVGDALGLPVQFKARDSYKLEDMIGYGTFGLPAGSWSDDTSLTLATCASIKRSSKIDIVDIRKCFEDWYYRGKFTPFGKAYDIGRTCSAAIDTGKGLDDEWSNGNGSLMRIIPLAFIPNVTDEQVANVSAITHAHPRTMHGCVLYIKIAKGLLEGRSLKECITEYVGEESEYARVRHIEERSREEIASSGYVVDTFEAAMWCLLTTGSYKECLLKATNLGDDTDTVGAVAGGLAGIIYGIDGIPKEWIEKLQAKNIMDEYLFNKTSLNV